MASIPLVGLSSNDPPGTYLAVNFAMGPASSGLTNYSVLLIGNKTTDGYATVDSVVYGPDTQTQMVSEDDVKTLFGKGSELHRMWKAFTNVNKTSSLYAIAVTESSGSQATGTVAITGTATAPATLRVTIGTTVIDAGIATGDTPTVIGEAIEAAINSNTDLPVTANNVTGTVTLTAKQKGLRGNFIRHNAQILPVAGTGVSVTPSARTAFTGGTSSDSNTNALAAIANTRYYYQVSAAEDATQFGALVSQIDANAQPTIGLRCRAIAGSVDTLANTITMATGRNSARSELVWQQNSDLTPAELAANAAAIYSLFETGLGAQRSLNFDSFGADATTQPYWKIPALLSGVTVSRTSIKSALNNGITPIAVSRPGVSYLVSRITTRSLNGAVSDYRTRDSHLVTVADAFSDDLINKASLELAGKLIGDDPATGQRVPGSQVVTPRTFKDLIYKLITEYAGNDLLQNPETIKANTQVVRETSPTTRLSARIPLEIIQLLHQTATNVDQVA